MGYKTCYRCNGYGYIHCFHTDGYNPFCIRCDGRGKYECSVCKGTGKIYVDDPKRPKSSSGGNPEASKKGGGIGGLVVIGIIIAALFGGEDQKSTEKIHQLFFMNNCNKPIRLAINYEKPNVGWVAAGWWKFSSREHAHLMSSNERLALKNHRIYFYAETFDKHYVWEGDKLLKFNDVTLPMREAILDLDKDNDLFFTLTCS